MSKLTENEFPHYFSPYLEILGKDNKSIVTHLEISIEKALLLLTSITKEKQNYRYADGKWTLKEVIQHVIDTERVFSYRALVFGRKDTAILPGFEENDYVKNSRANDRAYEDLLEELKLARLSTILLFKSFDESDLQNSGNASGNRMSVRALGYISSGHLLHHLKIIEDRYLV